MLGYTSTHTHREILFPFFFWLLSSCVCTQWRKRRRKKRRRRKKEQENRQPTIHLNNDRAVFFLFFFYSEFALLILLLCSVPMCGDLSMYKRRTLNSYIVSSDVYIQREREMNWYKKEIYLYVNQYIQAMILRQKEEIKYLSMTLKVTSVYYKRCDVGWREGAFSQPCVEYHHTEKKLIIHKNKYVHRALICLFRINKNWRSTFEIGTNINKNWSIGIVLLTKGHTRNVDIC
jgi:hypothetical protein